MIVFSRQVVFSAASMTMMLVLAAPALHSQRLDPVHLTLPDAPVPQIPADLGGSAAESATYSSSTLDQDQAPQTQSAPVPSPASSGQTDTGKKPMTNEEKRRASEEELQRELHQRIGVVVPNFNAVLDGSSLPLTPGQKMRAAFRSAIDPYQFGLALFTSAIGQAENSHSSYDPIAGTNPVRYMPEGYQQGWGAYGKRFGASFTDQFDGTIIGNGVLPVLLHQDARYYRMGKGPIKKRFLYSISTTVICRGDNGKRQANISNVLGNIAAGGISNLYYPAADRGFGLTIEQGLLVTAEGTFGALLIEFSPDLARHFRKKPLLQDLPTRITAPPG